MKILSAKWVLPMDGQVIENGEVVIERDVIVAVRPCTTPANERHDFGNSILMPGLVNAHTHLEYTALRGYIEDVSFFPWIRTLTAAKAYLDREDWFTSALLGGLECLSSGITTIGDNTDAGVTVDAANRLGLRGSIYQEYFCIDPTVPLSSVIDDLVAKISALQSKASSRIMVGVSPHATYTISAEGFSALAKIDRLKNLPLSIHVAESPAESELIENGTGPFAEMFSRRRIPWICPHSTPTQYVQRQGVFGPDTLLIHCVHQDDDDISIVEESRSPIIHCPKSNAKLGAGIAPLARWLERPELRLGIGTDSAVSNNSIDLFEEMRFALLLQRGKSELVETVTARSVLELATVRGADAMGLGSVVGTLTPGKQGDVIAVDLGGLHFTPTTDPYSALVYSARGSDVVFTMIDGQVCYDHGHFIGIDVEQIVNSTRTIRQKLPGVMG